MSKEKIINPFFDIRVEDIKATDSGIIVPRKAIFNAETDKLVSVVSTRYKIIHNRELVDKFEKHLAETDVKFQRTGAGTNRTGSQFWANYRFPKIKATIDIDDLYGNETAVDDNVELMMDVWNGYDGGQTIGYSLGGFRIVCLNGLRAFKRFFKSDAMHVGENDILDEIVLSFETAKQIFTDRLVPAWKDLASADFDKARAVKLVQSLELSKRYRKALGAIWLERQRNDKLKTMWQFYNMVTWFTTHVVENRNRQLANQISVQTSRDLMQDALAA